MDLLFFSFYDNASLSEEDIEKKKLSAPKGTKLYKNKILGLRGSATGIIFGNFDIKNHVVSKEYAKRFIRDKSNKLQIEWFEIFSTGLDTAYSSNSTDTISMSFIGITNKGNCFILDEKAYNNANLDTPIAPSDTVKNYIDFLERNRKEWGFAIDVFIESADQATITEFAKYKRLNGTVYDLNDITFKDDSINEAWEAIVKENKFYKLLDRATKKVLVAGDGAFKISFASNLSKYLIIEFYVWKRYL